MRMATVYSCLASRSYEFLVSERDSGSWLLPGVIPKWTVLIIMPVGFGVLALRGIWMAGGWLGRLIAATGLLIPIALAYWISPENALAFQSGIAVLILAALLGLPIFAVFGGFAL